MLAQFLSTASCALVTRHTSPTKNSVAAKLAAICLLQPHKLPSIMQAVQEVFCWSRNPMEVRRLTARKEEIYRDLLGERIPLVPAGARQLIDVLGKHQVGNASTPERGR